MPLHRYSQIPLSTPKSNTIHPALKRHFRHAVSYLSHLPAQDGLPYAGFLLLPALLLVAGFGVAQWRTQAVAAPVLERMLPLLPPEYAAGCRQ